MTSQYVLDAAASKKTPSDVRAERAAKAGHTAGPLKVTRAHRPDNTGGYDYAVSDSENRVVAEFFEHVGHVGHDGNGGYVTLPAQANAQLYVAAPDLVDAATKLISLIHRAQNRLTDYLVPDGNNDADECINAILEMLDGPELRRTEGLARAAISLATGGAK